MEDFSNTPPQLDTTNGLSGTSIKYIAIIAMLIDHIAYAFVTPASTLYIIMRTIGRITGATMFFFAVEGYHHTHNLKKYMGRLTIFAVISYLPYVYFTAGGTPSGTEWFALNVLFNILFGLLAVHLRHAKVHLVLKFLGIFGLLLLSGFADWSYSCILIMLLFDFFYGNFKLQALSYSLYTLLQTDVLSIMVTAFRYVVLQIPLSNLHISTPMFTTNMGRLLPILLLSFYNGKQGQKTAFSKWIFYIFYPLHLSVLVAIIMSKAS